MAAMATVLPILPGKTAEWQQIIGEVTGPRLAETQEFHRRLGLTKANWFLQRTPMGDLAIVYLEGEDPAASFQAWGASKHPFDLWFKSQLGKVYGIDLNEPPAGPPPEHVFSWNLE